MAAPLKQNDHSPKERTIRSETNKIFMIIFGILFLVGLFTITASMRSARTFSEFRSDHIDRYRAVETVKQNALDIIAIYYVLGTNQDQNLLMSHLMRYDELIKGFNESMGKLRNQIRVERGGSSEKISARLEETNLIFDRLNQSCREMTFALMEGKPEKAAPFFGKIDADVKLFKAALDEIEETIQEEMDEEIIRSEQLLEKVTWLGLVLTLGSLAVSLGLIYGLSKFLSLSLLPISNMMNNMRQSVFAIDRDMKVISPASRYSSVVFGNEVVGRSVIELFFDGTTASLESKDLVRSALETAFDGDDLQWMLSKEHLPRLITKEGSPRQHLQVSFTPLWDATSKLESVLTVVEDVTELESLRRDRVEKDRELQIIRELADAGRKSVQEFLADSHELVTMTLKPTSRLTPRLLMGLLHTLKGNAGMFRLTSISSEMHALESELEKLEVAELELDESLEFKERICKVFREYSDMASKFMEIESGWALGQGHTPAHSSDMLVIPYARYEKALSILREVHATSGAAEPVRLATAAVSRLSEDTLKENEFKLKAIVSKWAGPLQKEIELELVGSDVYLPRNRMKRLLDALGHLVRNSIDHGIETPEQRVRSGKPPVGKILISSLEAESGVVITLADDGRGVDVDMLRGSAIEKGHVSPEAAAKLSKDHALDLIFLPGFSTKKEVSEISGRGVGLNAVREIISGLGGSIQAQFSSNAKLRFEIRLPDVLT